MTREELIRELEALTERALGSESTKPAASVLLSLLGAMYSNTDVGLMRVTSQFSKNFLDQQNARRN